jgi:DNA-binding transcriptional MerR regulator
VGVYKFLDSIAVICDNTVMIETSDSAALSLDDLSNEVEQLLEKHRLVEGRPDQRVSPKADPRTIRYYTTLGLLDRPAIQGRQAKYNRRHVLQLLAIKSLQLTSLPLSEIQTFLYGLSNSELEAVIDSVALTVSERVRRAQKLVKPTVWKEIVIEPGLKLLAEEGWSSQVDQASLEEKIRAALSSLQIAARHENGGTRDADD